MKPRMQINLPIISLRAKLRSRRNPRHRIRLNLLLTTPKFNQLMRLIKLRRKMKQMNGVGVRSKRKILQLAKAKIFSLNPARGMKMLKIPLDMPQVRSDG